MKKRLLWVSLPAIFAVALIAVFINIIKDKAPAPGGAKKGSLAGLLSQAKNLEQGNNLLAAGGIYRKLVADFPGSPEVINWQKKIEDFNIRLLFSPTLTPKSAFYEIKAGDTLVKIAREFKTTPELIAKANNLSSGRIIPGRKIKVWNAPFSILVDKSQNILILKSDDEVFKTYIVSTGKDNSTPTGTFKITSKLVNPTWYKQGAVIPAGSPENILGTRWMGFDLPAYGIHGTTEPQSLGKQVTQGCVRMSNADVEQLFIIVPIGTEVTIVD